MDHLSLSSPFYFKPHSTVAQTGRYPTREAGSCWGDFPRTGRLCNMQNICGVAVKCDERTGAIQQDEGETDCPRGRLGGVRVGQHD